MRKVTTHPAVQGTQKVHVAEDDAYAMVGVTSVATALCGAQVKVPLRVQMRRVDCEACRRKLEAIRDAARAT